MGKMMTDKEKERMAIQMLNQGCASRKIQEACKISPNTLVAIRRKLNGVSPPQAMHTKAYELFETKQPFQVAVELGITEPEASKYYSEYRRLKSLDDLSWLYHTLGHKNISELKSLHRALTQKGVKPVQYATLIKKVDKIEILKSEEEKLGQQIMKLRNEHAALKQANDFLDEDNAYMKEQNEQLEWKNHQLKSEQDHLQIVVNKSLIEINNFEKQKMILIDKIDRLRAECLELDLKKTQLESSKKTLQVNFDDRRKTLIEDVEPYVIEAIREYVAGRMENVTIEDLIYDTSFGGILREMLEEPSGEFLESLIHAPSVSNN